MGELTQADLSKFCDKMIELQDENSRLQEQIKAKASCGIHPKSVEDDDGCAVCGLHDDLRELREQLQEAQRECSRRGELVFDATLKLQEAERNASMECKHARRFLGHCKNCWVFANQSWEVSCYYNHGLNCQCDCHKRTRIEECSECERIAALERRAEEAERERDELKQYVRDCSEVLGENADGSKLLAVLVRDVKAENAALLAKNAVMRKALQRVWDEYGASFVIPGQGRFDLTVDGLEIIEKAIQPNLTSEYVAVRREELKLIAESLCENCRAYGWPIGDEHNKLFHVHDSLPASLPCQAEKIWELLSGLSVQTHGEEGDNAKKR